MVLFRQMAREVALDHGIILSFLPKPIPGKGGNGFTTNDAIYGTTASLTDALDDLAADTALSTAVGAGLVENHIFMKRAEVEKTAALDADALRDWYIWYL